MRKDPAPSSARGAQAPSDARPASRPSRLPIVLTLVLLVFATLPPVRGNASLVATFLGVGAALLVWQGVLRVLHARGRLPLATEFVPPLRSHYIQAGVQICIYAYWGAYWARVYPAVPLILAQLVFLYVVDASLKWSRGRPWQLGFGPLPIVLSTNLFLWFREDWFVFQFLMLTVAALGKEFIQWERFGRRRHVFNPAAFGLAVCSTVLIVTGTTSLTWGPQVATTLGLPPYMYVLIFALGLVVQYFFAVTLMTLSAAFVLVALNLAYTAWTGVYQFTDTNIPIAIFLGLHLLVTDPATSPRSNLGRVVFGGLYGAANFFLYTVLLRFDIPEFYDKLLPIPILNLCVPWIDRLARLGPLGALTRWEASFAPRRANLAYMGVWTVLFTALWTTGFVGGSHPGDSIEFWRRAYAEGKPDAGPKLMRMIGAAAEGGSPRACNAFGELLLEGELTAHHPAAAAHYFSRACDQGELPGCANVARQFLFRQEAPSWDAVERALGRLEAHGTAHEEPTCLYLLGFAYETGRGRPRHVERAFELYRLAAARGSEDARAALARVALATGRADGLPADVVRALERGCADGDAQSCLYLAYLYGPAQREGGRADALLGRACSLGSEHACSVRDRTDRWSRSPPPEPPAVPFPPSVAALARRAGG